MYVCICQAVTARSVRDAIADGATDPVEVARRTGAGTNCGTCLPRTCRLLRVAGYDVAEPSDHDRFLDQVEGAESEATR